MYTQVEKPKENKIRAVADPVSQKKSHGKPGAEFVDGRPETADLIQRKIFINELVRGDKGSDDKKLTAASEDGYDRYYKDEGEMTKHLVSNEPVGVGLIKSRALWYRIPPLEAGNFFVFGENHNAITGVDIHTESHITKPILSEGFIGGTPETHIKNISDKADNARARVGLDENGSKLYQALKLAQTNPIKYFPPNPPALSSSAPGQGIPIPQIEHGELTARDNLYGSKKLAVRGVDGKATWWEQPHDTEPVASTEPKQYIAPVATAILGLMPLVFKDTILPKDISEHYKYFFDKKWTIPLPAGNHYRRGLLYRGIALEALCTYVKAKVIADYRGFRDKDLTTRNEVSDPDNADAFRNEYMLAGIIEGAKGNKYSLASIGDVHLAALEKRLSGYSLVKTSDLFGSYGRLAITPPDPYDAWQKIDPPGLSSSPSGYTSNKSCYQKLQEDLLIYKNISMVHRVAMAPVLLETAQNLMTKKSTKWSASSNQNKKTRVIQVAELINYLQRGIDLEKQYRI
jgi:hypothetical protein